MVTTKKTTTEKKPATKTTRKPKVVKEAVSETPVVHAEKTHAEKTPASTAVGQVNLAEGKYAWAVGRRKTSVANVRLFKGKGKSTVNKKEIAVYFGNKALTEQAFKPLQLSGLENQVYVYVNVSGGGINSQSQAVAHGIATALAKHNTEFRKVLKKNGLLTRDSRMKERKKPGLKRARRGPQWAKR